MAQIDLIMPKMGESVAEATIIRWLKKEGDRIDTDESLLEIATDKVDSDVPSPVAGILVKRLFGEDDIVKVGAVIAIIDNEVAVAGNKPVPGSIVTGYASSGAPAPANSAPVTGYASASAAPVQSQIPVITPAAVTSIQPVAAAQEFEIPGMEFMQGSGVSFVQNGNSKAVTQDDTIRFYSPLVKSIAQSEGISQTELQSIEGSGAEGRVTKADILNFVEHRAAGTRSKSTASAMEIPGSGKAETAFSGSSIEIADQSASKQTTDAQPKNLTAYNFQEGDEIVEMDRMRRLISEHMVHSRHTSAHVTSFVEADVTGMVLWRDRIKDSFKKRENESITFTPIFIEAVAKALKEFPLVNVSVADKQIIIHRHINIGMAAALPSGNLIVPVIKDADQKNLLGLTKSVNDLANRARIGKLLPDEVSGGTFTLTNVGSFGNIMGTPIINQPQVAILAVGAIKKKPAVITTEMGDVIAIRHLMYLSLSYDHRVVDGAMGGKFLKKVADHLEAFDTKREL